jgi:tRNA modification GTPase
MVVLSRRDDPIIAIASPPGRGAVGMVRISGKNLSALVHVICRRELKPRVAQLITIKNEQGQHIDQVLALFFPGPNSYTGEDVLELQGHGGPVVLQMLVQHCLEQAAQLNSHGHPHLAYLRLAAPGEFTERAYVNQKLDLAQAEAVADLIDANTRAAAISASRSLEGVFSKKINALLNDMIEVRMQIEACLDFPEEDIAFIEQLQIKQKIQKLQQQVNNVLADAVQGKLLRDGLKLVIAGQPNAGKSSLLNALSGTDSAIVTPIEGTTRDVLTELIQIQGVPVHVLDTAGLRELDKADEVEKIGIDRAWQQIQQADVVILLNDLSRSHQTDFADKQEKLTQELTHRVQTDAVILKVDNKADVAQVLDQTSEATVQISAKTGFGIQRLQDSILESAGWRSDRTQDICSARSRHLRSLEQMLEHLNHASQLLQEPVVKIDLLAEECRLAQNNLSDITGEFSNEDLLGEIFSRFCIGK